MRNPLKRKPEPIPKQDEEEDEAFSDEPEEEDEEEQEEIKLPTKKLPASSEKIPQQIVEREINLSLLNDKMNYIITLLNKFQEE